MHLLKLWVRQKATGCRSCDAAVPPSVGSPAANGSPRTGALLLRRPLALAMPASRADSPHASPADDQGYASGGFEAAHVAPADADAMFAGTLMSAQGGQLAECLMGSLCFALQCFLGVDIRKKCPSLKQEQSPLIRLSVYTVAQVQDRRLAMPAVGWHEKYHDTMTPRLQHVAMYAPVAQAIR